MRAATAATPDGGFDLLHRYDERSSWRTVLHVDPAEALTTLVVSLPTRDTVVVITALDADTTRLVSLDVRSGTRREVGGRANVDVERVLLDPVTALPQAYSTYGDRRQWTTIDPSIGDDLTALTRDPDVDLRIVDRSRDDRVWLVAHDAADRPSTYARWDRDARQLTTVLDDRRARRRCGSPVRPIALTARDGVVLHGYWTAPRRRDPPHPTVLLVHGGPWWRDQWELDPWVQWITHLGHACLQVNFRGSSGRGKTFLNAGNRQWGAAMQRDLIDALHHVVQRGWADPRQIVAMGSSFGGYAALMLAADGQVDAAIAHAAPTDLVAFLDAIPTEHPTMRHLWTTRVGDTTDGADTARLHEHSPLAHVDSIACPVLVVHGANDTRVPRQHADDLVAALRAAGRYVDYLLFSDEGHELQHPANVVEMAARIATFLARPLPTRT